MPRLDDANVADEYGPDRFMPREVDGGEGALDTATVRASYANWREEYVDIQHSLALAEFDTWLRQHDAEVAAKALEELSAYYHEQRDFRGHRVRGLSLAADMAWWRAEDIRDRNGLTPGDVTP